MSHRRYDTCPETTLVVPTRPSPMIRANQLEPLEPISAVVLDPDSDQHCFGLGYTVGVENEKIIWLQVDDGLKVVRARNQSNG